MMHRKARNVDSEFTNSRGMPTEASRAPPGLRATGDQVWRGVQRKNEAIQKIHPTLFGRLDSVDPVAIVERVARIEAALQELIKARESLLRAGSLEIDLIKRSAKRGERSIELLPREFRLLEYMMRRSNQLLTRATLLTEVWNYKFVPTTNLVDVHMGRLRHKVDAPNEIPMIHSVRGAGFVLQAPT
jgi:hypothetical protein